MQKIHSICVFCGSGPGTNPAFVEAAKRVGRILAERRSGLVYGGGAVGSHDHLIAFLLQQGLQRVAARYIVVCQQYLEALIEVG